MDLWRIEVFRMSHFTRGNAGVFTACHIFMTFLFHIIAQYDKNNIWPILKDTLGSILVYQLCQTDIKYKKYLVKLWHIFSTKY